MFLKHERLYPRPRTITVQGETVVFPQLALLAWASLTRRNLTECPAGTKRFPVVIDTGFSHNLLIRQSQARDWAGLAIPVWPTAPWRAPVSDASGYRLSQLQECTFEGATGTTADSPTFAADLWLHSSESGGTSMRLELFSDGFVLCPTPTTQGSPPGPSLPLLGSLALFMNDIKLVVDYKNLDFTLGEQV